MLAASWPSFAGPWQNQNRGAHPKDFEEKEAAEKMLRKNPMDTIIGQDFQLYRAAIAKREEAAPRGSPLLN